MFGFGKKSNKTPPDNRNAPKGSLTWDIPIFFGILFILSIAELYFTVDSFIYLQRKHEWWSGTERARLGFLIFSSARTIALSAVYIGFHFARKVFHSMFHTTFVVLSTILWIISGIIIHQMWGYFECGGIGALQGGLNECHEVKIIEILAWVIAGVSIIATVPVVMTAMKRRRMRRQQKQAAGRKTALAG